jgi:integrase
VVNDFAHDFVASHKVTVGKSTVIARRLTHMRKFFKELEGRSVKVNPVPEQFLQKLFRKSEFSVKKNQYLFSNAELASIKKEIKSELNGLTINNMGTRLAIWIDLETGMRPGELQALRFQNLVVKDGYPTFKINDSWSDYTNGFNGSLKSRPKGAFRYCLPISNDLAAFLTEYQKKQDDFLRSHYVENPEDLVFLNLHDYKAASNKIPITQRSMNQMLKKLCKQLDIQNGDEKLSMYSFRHTICTKLANKPKISYPWAAERMGHSVAMFMKTYVKTDADVDKQMVENWLE